MFSTYQLNHVLTLARHRNYTRAAKALHLSQPALSQSIKKLEQRLKVRLFDRGRGRVEPTAFGRLVADEARILLSSMSELENKINLLQGLETGTLEVTLAPYPSALSGQHAVAKLLSSRPEIQCRVRVAGFTEVADDVEKGRCDLGIADFEAASKRALVTELLVRRQLCFFARSRHPLVARRRCTLDDLLAYPWAGIRAPARIAAALPSDMGRAGRWIPETGQFVPALEVDVVSEFLVLARESDILVIATLTMAERELKEGQLVVLSISPEWFQLAYGFISRPNHTLSPATLEFMAIMRGIEDDLEKREARLRKRHF